MPDTLNEIIDAHIKDHPEARCFWWNGTWRPYSHLGALADAWILAGGKAE